MLQRKLVVFALTGIALFPVSYAFAAQDESAPPRAMEQKQVRGSEVMTREEQVEHRKEMRKARTKEEREKVRKEQHERMKKKAEERGMSMPDQPPERGQGMGPGGGGGMMGPGGGMGPGGNRGQ